MFGKIFITQLRNCVMLVTPLIRDTDNTIIGGSPDPFTLVLGLRLDGACVHVCVTLYVYYTQAVA